MNHYAELCRLVRKLVACHDNGTLSTVPGDSVIIEKLREIEFLASDEIGDIRRKLNALESVGIIDTYEWPCRPDQATEVFFCGEWKPTQGMQIGDYDPEHKSWDFRRLNPHATPSA